MGFMKPTIFPGVFAKVDTYHNGVVVVLLDRVPENDWAVGKSFYPNDTAESADFAPTELMEGILTSAGISADDSGEYPVNDIEIVQGFGYQLSASGFMDQTDLCVAKTEEEAAAELIKLYYDVADDEMDDDQRNECRQLENIASRKECFVVCDAAAAQALSGVLAETGSKLLGEHDGKGVSVMLSGAGSAELAKFAADYKVEPSLALQAVNAKLPEVCYAEHPTTGRIIQIERDSKGLLEVPVEQIPDGWTADDMNWQIGVTPAQRDAMQARHLFGPLVPGADPDNKGNTTIKLAVTGADGDQLLVVSPVPMTSAECARALDPENKGFVGEPSGLSLKGELTVKVFRAFTKRWRTAAVRAGDLILTCDQSDAASAELRVCDPESLRLDSSAPTL